MDEYAYTDEQRDIMRQCFAKRDAWLEFYSKAPWEVTDDDKKNGYCIS